MSSDFAGTKRQITYTDEHKTNLIKMCVCLCVYMNMVAYAYNPNTPDTEAGESQTLCQPGLQNMIPSQKP